MPLYAMQTSGGELLTTTGTASTTKAPLKALVLLLLLSTERLAKAGQTFTHMHSCILITGLHLRSRS